MIVSSRGVVVWLTGPSGAGKSTLAQMLAAYLDFDVIDEPEVWRSGAVDLGCSREAVRQSVLEAGLLAAGKFCDREHGGRVVVAMTSPYRIDRHVVLHRLRQLGAETVEACVTAALEVLRARDPLGLYAGHDAGTVEGLAGVDVPYELPDSETGLIIDTGEQSRQESFSRLAMAVVMTGAL